MDRFFSELDRYLFGVGRHYQIYEKMGAHPCTYEGKKGVHFAVWAPHAKAVSLVCDRNGWNPEGNAMINVADSGVFECFIPEMGENELYKYAILTQKDEWIYKADPYAFSSEFRPGNASVTANIEKFPWTDKEWMKSRKKTNWEESPMAIYEVHIGSWKREGNPERNGFISYQKAGRDLAEYCNYTGYTHV